MKKILLALPIVILILASCNQNKQLDKYKWMLGHWVASDGEGEFHEKWYENSDAEFYGNAYIVLDGDTTFGEDLELSVANDTLKYIVHIGEAYTAKFTSTELKDKEFEVKFPKNDFPSAIKYVNVSNNKMIVTLTGDEDGVAMQQVIEFERVD